MFNILANQICFVVRRKFFIARFNKFLQKRRINFFWERAEGKWRGE